MILDIVSVYILAGLVVALLFFRENFKGHPYFNTFGKQFMYIVATIVAWPYALYCWITGP